MASNIADNAVATLTPLLFVKSLPIFPISKSAATPTTGNKY